MSTGASAGPPPEQARLARELTALRERTGLSLAALAARTTASRSSWQRYLCGGKLPPRELVRELCLLAGERPGRLLLLWELADEARRSPAAQPPPQPSQPSPPLRTTAAPPGTAPEPGPGAGPDAAPGAREDAARRVPGRGRRLRRRLLVAVLSIGTLIGLVGAYHGVQDRSGPATGPVKAGCRGSTCTGENAQSQACAIASSGPRTVAERRFAGKKAVDIRYSEGCDAGWARIRFGSIGDRVEISAPGEERQSVRIADRYDAEGYLSTRMTGGGPRGLEACLVSGDTGERHCFTS
ncbi:DUF2690 domain-containing protein [Streptomyces sp. 549]|uniref:DUF2690 domain-containing protein n=1 Tax=Streptomyces sp. 549 TaxID=3049076 RepID=UPI0024C3B2F3|nr:DUF2690 domain-containing protein [Streptomyces sp. 549]MDK1474908.1 DUF2690 domain-containing protein [Streptomyces sp. 549]